MISLISSEIVEDLSCLDDGIQKVMISFSELRRRNEKVRNFEGRKRKEKEERGKEKKKKKKKR